MKSAVDDGTPVVVLTADDKPYSELAEISSEVFKKAFKVDQIDGKNSKVILGFKLRSTTTLSAIKQRLMKHYLIPHELFLREHIGGFQNGLKNYIYGFLKHDHPDHPDLSSLKTRFARVTSVAWKTLDKGERSKWKEEEPQIFYADGIALPINFSKERVVAEEGGKPKLNTYAIAVSTPKRFGPLLRQLLDIAILGKKINNLIPFAFQKEDPAGYYQLLSAQERFMEQHRNIPIFNVPYDASTHQGSKGETLSQVLNGNKDIMRVAYDPKYNKYHVSTTAPKYKEVHKWISGMLEDHGFPYQPTVRPLKYTSDPKTSVKYSGVFADAISVANSSFDTSTIRTTPSNAWKHRPPLDILYVPTAEAFPPLPRKHHTTQATPSTTSGTCDEETIQSAISSAIKTLQEQHRLELDQLKREMQKKMDEMESQMKNLGKQVALQTYQALVTDDSPLAMKSDHVTLKHDMSIINTQLTTLIQMVSSGSGIMTASPMQPAITLSPPRNSKRHKQNRTPEKANLFGDHQTQENNTTSATSDSDEEFEGCDK